MKRVAFALLIAAILFSVVYAGRLAQSPPATEITHTITTSGDTAKIYKMHTFTGRDSFAYIDTFHGVWVDTVDSVVAWTSPLQVRRFTATLDTELVYACSLDCGTNIYGFELTCPNGATYSLDSLLNDLTDSINAVSGMADTVTAEDSATYIKLTSNFAMDNLEGAARWTLVLGDSLAEGDSTFTTIAMVCDSMVAAINAADTISNHVTAANSGDTVYTVTANTRGVTFTLSPGDSAQDTSVTKANATSWSTVVDTFGGFSMCCPEAYKSIYGMAILRVAKDSTDGYGGSDSGWIWVYAEKNGAWVVLDSSVSEGLPDTLFLKIGADTTGGAVDPDTLYGSMLHFVVKVKDTCTVVGSGPYHHGVDWEFILR